MNKPVTEQIFKRFKDIHASHPSSIWAREVALFMPAASRLLSSCCLLPLLHEGSTTPLVVPGSGKPAVAQALQSAAHALPMRAK